MTDLKGKVAIITGGARGQGAVEGRLFMEAGATVVLTDVLDEEGEKTAGELGCDYLPHDVSSESDWDSVVADVVKRHGGIDVLINNAGIYNNSPMMETSLADFNKVLEVNAAGVFLGMQKVGAVMAEAGSGSIVNISSVAGLMGARMAFAYAASKWAVRGMSKSAARELGHRGVRVNSVHPGFIDTEMLTQTSLFSGGEELSQQALAMVPLGRVGEPIEIGQLVLFLASDDSSYCTGHEFVADGGLC